MCVDLFMLRCSVLLYVCFMFSCCDAHADRTINLIELAENTNGAQLPSVRPTEQSSPGMIASQIKLAVNYRVKSLSKDGEGFARFKAFHYAEQDQSISIVSLLV